jgi:hypothetical protein
MIWLTSHVIVVLWSWLTMQICDSYTRMLLVFLMVLGWNSESLKLVPHFWLLAQVARCLNLIWRLLPLRLKILNTNLIILLATLFYSLLTKHVSLSRASVQPPHISYNQIHFLSIISLILISKCWSNSKNCEETANSYVYSKVAKNFFLDECPKNMCANAD